MGAYASFRTGSDRGYYPCWNPGTLDEPATKAGENTMEVQVEEYIENTFEHQYLFRNKGAAESGTLWWMCQKKNFQETAKDNIPKVSVIFHQSM